MKKLLIAVIAAVALCAVDWVRFYGTAPAAELPLPVSGQGGGQDL